MSEREDIEATDRNRVMVTPNSNAQSSRHQQEQGQSSGADREEVIKDESNSVAFLNIMKNLTDSLNSFSQIMETNQAGQIAQLQELKDLIVKQGHQSKAPEANYSEKSAQSTTEIVTAERENSSEQLSQHFDRSSAYPQPEKQREKLEKEQGLPSPSAKFMRGPPTSKIKNFQTFATSEHDASAIRDNPKALLRNVLSPPFANNDLKEFLTPASQGGQVGLRNISDFYQVRDHKESVISLSEVSPSRSIPPPLSVSLKIKIFEETQLVVNTWTTLQSYDTVYKNLLQRFVIVPSTIGTNNVAAEEIYARDATDRAKFAVFALAQSGVFTSIPATTMVKQRIVNALQYCIPPFYENIGLPNSLEGAYPVEVVNWVQSSHTPAEKGNAVLSHFWRENVFCKDTQNTKVKEWNTDVFDVLATIVWKLVPEIFQDTLHSVIHRLVKDLIEGDTGRNKEEPSGISSNFSNAPQANSEYNLKAPTARLVLAALAGGLKPMGPVLQLVAEVENNFTLASAGKLNTAKTTVDKMFQKLKEMMANKLGVSLAQRWRLIVNYISKSSSLEPLRAIAKFVAKQSEMTVTEEDILTAEREAIQFALLTSEAGFNVLSTNKFHCVPLPLLRHIHCHILNILGEEACKELGASRRNILLRAQTKTVNGQQHTSIAQLQEALNNIRERAGNDSTVAGLAIDLVALGRISHGLDDSLLYPLDVHEKTEVSELLHSMTTISECAKDKVNIFNKLQPSPKTVEDYLIFTRDLLAALYTLVYEVLPNAQVSFFLKAQKESILKVIKDIISPPIRKLKEKVKIMTSSGEQEWEMVKMLSSSSLDLTLLFDVLDTSLRGLIDDRAQGGQAKMVQLKEFNRYQSSRRQYRQERFRTPFSKKEGPSSSSRTFTESSPTLSNINFNNVRNMEYDNEQELRQNFAEDSEEEEDEQMSLSHLASNMTEENLNKIIQGLNVTDTKLLTKNPKAKGGVHLVREGAWICLSKSGQETETCGYCNWPQKLTCQKCKTPRPTNSNSNEAFVLDTAEAVNNVNRCITKFAENQRLAVITPSEDLSRLLADNNVNIATVIYGSDGSRTIIPDVTKLDEGYGKICSTVTRGLSSQSGPSRNSPQLQDYKYSREYNHFGSAPKVASPLRVKGDFRLNEISVKLSAIRAADQNSKLLSFPVKQERAVRFLMDSGAVGISIVPSAEGLMNAMKCQTSCTVADGHTLATELIGDLALRIQATDKKDRFDIIVIINVAVVPGVPNYYFSPLLIQDAMKNASGNFEGGLELLFTKGLRENRLRYRIGKEELTIPLLTNKSGCHLEAHIVPPPEGDWIYDLRIQGKDARYYKWSSRNDNPSSPSQNLPQPLTKQQQDRMRRRSGNSSSYSSDTLGDGPFNHFLNTPKPVSPSKTATDFKVEAAEFKGKIEAKAPKLDTAPQEERAAQRSNSKNYPSDDLSDGPLFSPNTGRLKKDLENVHAVFEPFTLCQCFPTCTLAKGVAARKQDATVSVHVASCISSPTGRLAKDEVLIKEEPRHIVRFYKNGNSGSNKSKLSRPTYDPGKERAGLLKNLCPTISNMFINRSPAADENLKAQLPRFAEFFAPQGHLSEEMNKYVDVMPPIKVIPPANEEMFRELKQENLIPIINRSSILCLWIVLPVHEWIQNTDNSSGDFDDIKESVELVCELIYKFVVSNQKRIVVVAVRTDSPIWDTDWFIETLSKSIKPFEQADHTSFQVFNTAWNLPVIQSDLTDIGESVSYYLVSNVPALKDVIEKRTKAAHARSMSSSDFSQMKDDACSQGLKSTAPATSALPIMAQALYDVMTMNSLARLRKSDKAETSCVARMALANANVKHPQSSFLEDLPPQVRPETGNRGSHRKLPTSERVTELQLVLRTCGRSIKDLKMLLDEDLATGVHLVEGNTGVGLQKPRASESIMRSKNYTKQPQRPATRPLQRIGMDIISGGRKTVGTGHVTYLFIVDHFSSYTWAFPVDDNGSNIKAGFLAWNTETGAERPLEIITDHDPRFTSSVFTNMLVEKGFRLRTSVPYNQRQNGKTERTWGLISGKIIFCLNDANLSTIFWGHAMNYSILVHNAMRIQHPTEDKLWTTPYQLHFSTKPNLRILFRWGSRVVAHSKGHVNQFATKTKEGIALGRSLVASGLTMLNPLTGLLSVVDDYAIDNEHRYNPEAFISIAMKDPKLYPNLGVTIKRLKSYIKADSFSGLGPLNPKTSTLWRYPIGTKLLLSDQEEGIIVGVPSSIKFIPNPDYEVLVLRKKKTAKLIVSPDDVLQGVLQYLAKYDVLNTADSPQEGDIIYVKWGNDEWWQGKVIEVNTVLEVPQDGDSPSGFKVEFATKEWEEYPNFSTNMNRKWLRCPAQKNGQQCPSPHPILAGIIVGSDGQNAGIEALEDWLGSNQPETTWEVLQLHSSMLFTEEDLEDVLWYQESMEVDSPVNTPGLYTIITTDSKEKGAKISNPFIGMPNEEIKKELSRLVNSLPGAATGSIKEPATAGALKALKKDEADVWKTSDHLEVFSLQDTGALVLSNRLPRGVKLIVLPAFFVRKAKMEGGVYTKPKSRMVVGGNRDPTAYTAIETASTMIPFDEMKLFLSEAVRRGIPVQSGDITCAFLQAPLPSHLHIYVRMPKELEKDFPGYPFFRLRKSVYGLKIAPKMWEDFFAARLKELGLSRPPGTMGLFVGKVIIPGLAEELCTVWLIVHVDDFLHFGASSQATAQFKKKLQEVLPVTFSDGPASFFCGIQLDWQTNEEGHLSLLLHQEAYASAMLRMFYAEVKDKIWDTRPHRGALTPSGKFIWEGLPDSHTESRTGWSADVEDQEFLDLLPHGNLYSAIVGSLIWLTKTRPDIELMVKNVAAHAGHVQQEHCIALATVIRYINETTHIGIGFHESGIKMSNAAELLKFPQECAISDANLGGPHFRKSTCSWTLLRSGGPVSAHIDRSLMCSSTCESELGAMAKAVQTIQWADKWLTDCFDRGLHRPVNLLTDNAAAQTWTRSSNANVKTRHLGLRGNICRYAFQENLILPCHIASGGNPVDIMTKDMKSLQHPGEFHKLREVIMGHSRSQAIAVWSVYETYPQLPDTSEKYANWVLNQQASTKLSQE